MAAAPLLALLATSLALAVYGVEVPVAPGQAATSEQPRFHSMANTCGSATWCTAESDWPANGVPSSDGYPTYYERATYVLYNMVRAAPAFYRDNFICNRMYSTSDSCSAVFATMWPAVAPIPPSLNLARAGRAHSTDRQTCASSAGGSPHNDCNSTATFTRIAKFSGGGSGEIFWDYGSFSRGALAFIHVSVGGWICDSSTYSSGQYTTCPADGSASGHRSLIMGGATQVGCGMTYVSNRAIWTCDQGSGSSNPYAALTIRSAAHVPSMTSLSSYNYYLNFYSRIGTSPTVTVYINGVPETMTLQSGLASMGTYMSTLKTAASNDSCINYYFTANAERYPAAGYFFTNAFGACTSDYSDSSVAPTVDCGVSAWSSFSACTIACGNAARARNGTQTRTRTVLIVPSSGGAACPSLVNTTSCSPCSSSAFAVAAPTLVWSLLLAALLATLLLAH